MAGRSADAGPERYGDIVVVGGGCYGSYYVRQLGRAAGAGALSWRRLVVVDRDARCAVARDAPAGTSVVVQDWGEFFDGWLPRVADGARDAIVPSPLMPHVFFEYLARRVRTQWPGRAVGRAPPGAPVGTPWERAAPDGTAYVSHATWTCPINCVEPHICPHTRDVRGWTMPESLAEWAESRALVGDSLLGPFTFHCTHRAHGVGMVDKEPIQRAERAIAEAASRGMVRALVSTASHCHGAAAVLSIGPIVQDGD